MKLKWDDKDPDDVDAFQLDWSERLSSETITSSTWSINPATGTTPLTKNTDQFTTTMTTIWLSGGDDDADYELTNHVTTTAGRAFDQTVKLRVRSR